MKLLTADENIFNQCCPAAAKFLFAAQLRHEAFSLLCNNYRNEWENIRLRELLKTPACQARHFINKPEYIKYEKLNKDIK